MATRQRFSTHEASGAAAQVVGEDRPLEGEVIEDRYRIDELIGQGGMARVYSGVQLRLDRPVAIKVVHQGLSQMPEIAKRFKREAKVVSKLDHPNCVAIHDTGELEDGSLFFVMPLIEGEVLAERLDEGPLNVLGALHVMKHLLAALHHAHQMGVIHRDVKPDNIMLVEWEGDPDFARLLDFGIAKLADTVEEKAEALTQMGQRFGTPDYMAPEQVLGAETDHRTDIYAATCVLYHMLTGKPPFVGEDEGAVMAMHAGKPPPTLKSASKTQFDKRLEDIIHKGLAKRREERFQTARAMSILIEDVMRSERGEAPSQRALTMTERVQRAKDRSTMVAGARWSGRQARRLFGLMRRHPRVVASMCLTAALGAGAFYMMQKKANAAKRPISAWMAMSLLDEGEPGRVVELLEWRGEALEGDPDSQLVLGHAHAALRQYPLAFSAYQRAYRADERAGDDPTMRVNLHLMLADDRDDIAIRAGDFLISQLDDEEAREQVVTLASQHNSVKHRERMRALADAHELGQRIDRLQAYELDLKGHDSCEARQEVVARLRALGDPAAVPALKAALERKQNDCLRQDAEDAVRFLEGLSEPARSM